MKSTRFTLSCLASIVLIGATSTYVCAKTADWDQVANIQEAATRLGKIQKRQGATKAFEFIVNCYKTHSLGSKYSKYFEACIAQDYIHTQTLALIYSRVPRQALKKMRAPSPEVLAKAMGERVAGAFNKYSIPTTEANEFKRLVDKHGFAPFNAIVFPKKNPDDGEPDPAIKSDDNEKQTTP